MDAPLGDVVALVVSRPLGPVDTKQAISKKLESMGARVAHRVSKEVTHIIFHRQRAADEQQQLTENSELRSLYAKTAKMDFPVSFVSPLWVESCLTEQRRVMERRFAVAQPPASLFTYSSTPRSGPGNKKPKRRRSELPKAPDHYQLDSADPLFSSSQQIRGGISAAGVEYEEVASPAVRDHAGFSCGRKRGAVALLKEAAMDEDCCGTGTQIAAEMLTGLGENLASSAQQTLLALKADTSGSKIRKSGGSSTASGKGRRPKSALTPATMPGNAAKGAKSNSAPQPARKVAVRCAASRLKQRGAAANAVSPGSKMQNTVGGDTSTSKQGGTNPEPLRVSTRQRCSVRGGPIYGPLGAAVAGCGTSELVADAAALSLSPANTGVEERDGDIGQVVTDVPPDVDMEKGCRATKGHALVSQRALREVQSRAEIQMPILRTGLQPQLPTSHPSTGQPIPVPQVRRVDSPWTQFRPVPSSATPSVSVLAPNPRPPPVWSQSRPWDPASRDAVCRAPATAVAEAVAEAGFSGDHGRGAEDADSADVGPSQGCLALSSVEVAIQELARSAVKRLRGLRLCPEGAEDRITHLVVDKERRTLKVLLAIANGAWLLAPAWLTASLEAGSWLPEAPFQAEVRFAEAAKRSRRALAAGGGGSLLRGFRVHVHSSDQATRGLPNNAPALKRLTVALGGKIVARQDASLCVVTGTLPGRPSGLPPSCKAVREEWLLQATEHYTLPVDDASWVV